jgi:hypothetical protein
MKFRSPECFLKIYRENLEFLTKRTPTANPGYAYEWLDSISSCFNVLNMPISTTAPIDAKTHV